jgi:molybdate transport system substrate-binding protein
MPSIAAVIGLGRRSVARARLLTLVCLGISSSAATQAGEVQVAVAANFAAPMARIAQAFTAATGHVVKLSSGATGKFYSQVVAGAPFDVLLSADDETPRRLVAAGHALDSSRFTYATGRLVLWSPKPGFVDAQGSVLSSGRFRHLAIANPKVAPYGRAAMQVLRERGLAEALAPRLVTGESIAQAFQFVATGNAELGFVALSQVIAAKPVQGDSHAVGNAAGPVPAVTGSSWLVPESLHAPILQDAVLLKAGEHNAAAAALLAYLQSAPARQLMRAFGYGP